MNVVTSTVHPVFEVPWERRGVLAPGLPILPPGVERYPVPGGGSRAVPVFQGDEIIVLDKEGLQMGQLTLFTPDGRSDAAMLGAAGSGRPAETIELLANGSRSGRRVLEALAGSGFNLAQGDAISVFGDGSRPGDQESYSVECDGLLICAAPGGPMRPDLQNTPTEVILYVRRGSPAAGKERTVAPDPLADPQQDFNIQPGAATSYFVREGEYIQILDVKGRECSDFQAFSLRALDKGLEREIDPTTTRSLMGMLYPTPGMFSKYWSVDHEPLVEIVQDTCGRHDTFGLACTARYYEDMGYPGHVNCSDNINADLARHGVRPRGGWPAINFFFNTMLDETNVIGLDEPWSRPGDYVLLRALSDLVCISSACPCDIDPANGWNPTDIQVRTYSPEEEFVRSSGYRRSAGSDPEETKETGFHDCFARHTRDFTEYNGYWLPNSFPSIGTIGEYWAARERAVVMDLSPLRKYEVTGPDAEALLQLCVTRDVSRLSVGQVIYTAMCYEHGGMIDDGTVYRLGEMNFRWIGGNDTSGLWLREQATARGLSAWVRSSTDQLHNIAVQGRYSRDILSQVFWTPPARPTVEELPWFRMTVARVGSVNGAATVISRTGYSGELGYEVFCHPKDAVQILDRIWEAGEPFGMVPLGLAALDMLRIESGLIFAGSEFDDRTDPFEAGIGFTVPRESAKSDFIGREALMERRAHPQRRLVGLDIKGGVVPSAGDCLRIGRAQVGEITSAMKSPVLGRVIALARVAVTYAKPGTEIEVGQLDGQQKRLKAVVSSFPHFDPKKERVKGIYG